MEFNLIGPGRLGMALLRALLHAGAGRLLGVYGRDAARLRMALSALGAGFGVSGLHALPAARLTIIATPDDAIADVAMQLAEAGTVVAGSVVVHCSGVHASGLLSPLREQGCWVASMHPLRAFAGGEASAETFRDCYVAVEGDDRALAVIRPLLESLGARLLSVRPEAKAQYHAAAVMASNYLVTLAAAAQTLFRESGLEDEEGMAVIVSLMQGSLDNLARTQNPEKALTGPLMRGDIATIRAHLEALAPGGMRTLYQQLGMATLPIVGGREVLENALSPTLSRD